MKKRLLFLAATAVVLSACDNNNNSGPAQPQSLSAFVMALISGQTNETALPVDLTQVSLDTSSENPADFSGLFAPGG